MQAFWRRCCHPVPAGQVPVPSRPCDQAAQLSACCPCCMKWHARELCCDLKAVASWQWPAAMLLSWPAPTKQAGQLP